MKYQYSIWGSYYQPNAPTVRTKLDAMLWAILAAWRGDVTKVSVVRFPFCAHWFPDATKAIQRAVNVAAHLNGEYRKDCEED